MKYIDAEKLKAEIEKRMEKHWNYLPDADSPEDDWTHNELCELGAYKELEHIESFLDSQQKQPDVDLELRKRIEELANDWHHKGFASDEDCPLCMQDLMDVLWHFYELGRKQVLQEIYDGKTKPVDKITAAWLDDKEEDDK